MKNCILTLIFVLSLPLLLFSQDNKQIAQGLKALDQVPRMIMPGLDNESLLAEEMERRGPGIAPRFAENMEVNINPQTHGTWETLKNGNEVWRMRIYSAGAKSLNLGFSKYIMPAGGSLILYTPKRSEILGPFTPSDNEEHEELWTPIVEGDELIIEVQVPSAEKNNLQLHLKSVNHDFLGFAQMSVLSGSCNLDVICGEADGWGIVDGYRDIIRSVAVIGTGGGTFCTGFLVNNANNDCTPFFMTANHCGINAGNAASLVAYWNYESPTCRQPNSGASGGNGNGSLADFNTGAIHRASYAPSDVTLVEFDDPVSETANAFFAGWSTEFIMPQDTVIGIHHPSTDEKRISFEFDATEPGMGLNGNIIDIATADHIIVPDWDIGTTEGGSSGSPLFNSQKQVVGQLHGGAAACGNDAYDTYGWFYTSWEGGGNSSNALKYWLDPNDTGITEIDGKDCSFSIGTDISSQELCAPSDAVYTLSIAENFVSDVTLSAPGLPTGATVTFAPNPVPPNGSAVMTVSNTGAVASGQYQIEVQGTDGVNDANTIVSMTLFEAAPVALGLMMPPDAETSVNTSPAFIWDAASAGTSYSIEVATDVAFANVVDMATGLSTANYNGNFLDVLTTYYWRVRGTNICGDGPWSSAWSFTTADISCGTPAAVDVPVEITSDGTPTVVSTIDITATGEITDIIVSNVDVSHTYVGDLQMTLQSPTGVVVLLMDRPGVPATGFGCPGDNVLLSFDDNAANTADDLENSCADVPAIEGTYQPIEALNALLGEDPNGLWTLTVTDNADQDGGVINGWAINICTVIPFDLSLALSDEELTNCVDDGDIEFTLTVGNAFEASGVTLSASGNPMGSMVTFSSNPAMPGEVVTVTISGANTLGDYPIVINAMDGVNNENANFGLFVEEAPTAANLVYPADSEIDVPLVPTMEWAASADATEYNVEVATDAAFTDVLAATTTPDLTYMLPGGLNFGSTYYWRVEAVGPCGATASMVNEFVTILDLAVAVTPESQTACISEEAVFSVSVGPGFIAAPASITYSINPNVGVTVGYDVDPNDVMPGSTVTATVSDLINAAAGTYTITFTIADANNTNDVSTELIVDAPPATAGLATPANGADQVVLMPSFSWNVVAEADDYLIEIASDELFANVIESQTTTASNYTMTSSLEMMTVYYWRVFAQNDCGASLAEPFSFTTEIIDAVEELEGNAFQILPNPTKGQIEIIFEQLLTKDLTVEVYSINGQLLQQLNYANGVERLPVALDYASGVYVLRLKTADATVARRVVLQK